MKTKSLSKAERHNWEPLKKVAAIKINAKNIKGEKVIVPNTSSRRLVIA